ncbi:spermatogenesis-associated protein 46 [Myotis daubentonii]|uniref:spermatogenesis-associated protein 46 n=1 Tax=Myotis daubentonii TaxID=98922 RepID=UPI002873851C|nr:spermatogenesis-associated protein 46 [Myotis daubentonii]
MESFSLLSISGPRVSSSALSTFPDLMSPRVPSLPDIAKTTFPTEAPSPAQAPLPQHPSSALRQGVVLSPGEPPAQAPPAPGSDPALSFADCMLGDPQNGEQPRRSCTIYRPWFSPYSYFVCVDKEGPREAHGFPELPRDEGRGDSGLMEDTADSLRSSSSSPENPGPREAKARHGDTDHISSQDILRASRGLPAQQTGFKCAACCRMYPTLCSLKSHIKCGFREGFSCRVFYRKLKALWARPADRLPLGGGQARK